MRISDFLKSAVLISVIPLLGCSESTEPQQDLTPPNIEINLGIYPDSADFCSHAAFYYIDPRGSSDNTSSSDELRARWDFENDGIWDTEFAEVESILDFLPRPLLASSWQVKCEMQDMDGNSTVKIDSMQLPEWLPIPPDIVAGEVRVHAQNSYLSSVDTFYAGESFVIYLGRRDWINESGVQISQRYYIDDHFIGENTGQTNYPNPGFCSASGYAVSGGISTPGTHEIRVEAKPSEGVVETNGKNNSATCVVYVVGD